MPFLVGALACEPESHDAEGNSLLDWLLLLTEGLIDIPLDVLDAGHRTEQGSHP